MSEPCVLAVDAGGTSLKAALVQPGGRIVPDSFLQVPVDSRGSAEEIAGAYSALARDAGKLAGKLGLEIVRASVCIPGPFDYAGGVSLMKHKYQSVFGVPLRPWFIKTLGNIPVTFLHDSTAFLLGAVKAEELARHRRICGVIIGTGLGFASMYDGQMNLNPQGGPGISIFARPFGEGTAEDYVSRRAIERAYSRKHPQRAVPSVKDIAGLAMAGDLISGRETLEDVNMIVYCGGFSNSDVLGSAKGWAGGFLFNPKAKEALDKFYAREDTLSLGICNGCQLMMELGLINPEHKKQGKMLHNDSHKFESTFISLTIPTNRSVMFGSLSGSKLGIWVAHGEGKFSLPYGEDKYNVVAKYSYDEYPGNPNGSDYSIAALASADGRHLAMMPHLERAIFPWQNACYPADRIHRDQVTPWIEAFVNERKLVEDKMK